MALPVCSSELSANKVRSFASLTSLSTNIKQRVYREELVLVLAMVLAYFLSVFCRALFICTCYVPCLKLIVKNECNQVVTKGSQTIIFARSEQLGLFSKASKPQSTVKGF